MKVSVDLRDPAHLLAFGFGSGLAPKAPGTAGTLAAIPLYLLLAQLPFGGYLAATVLVIVIGIWAAGASSRKLGVHDHSGIVIDEFAGFLVTMIPVTPTLATLCAGFMLFRLFDILKPWPVSVLDRRVHGGVGIMVDDLGAGIYAAACLYALAIFFPAIFPLLAW